MCEDPARVEGSSPAWAGETARFEQRGLKKKVQAWTATLPSLEGGPHVVAIAVKLRKGGVESRYSPTVVETVQVVAHIGDEKVQTIPVPDTRQYGNTQEGWVIEQWWQESTQPLGDGYYGDAPS